MPDLEYFLGSCIEKGAWRLHTAAVLALRGKRPSLCRALHPRHTQLISSPSTLLTNFTGGWESNENSLHCMFI